MLPPLQQEQHLSPPILQVEEEEEAEQEEEGFVDLTESTDSFEVFNKLSPPKNVPEEMGIQRKPQRSIQELLESQPGKGEAGKPSQPKRRREPKGKEVMETGRPRPSNEEEAHKIGRAHV